MATNVQVRMGLIPFHLAEFVDEPGQLVQVSSEFGGAFPADVSQMTSVAWSSDPALGLPVAPAIVSATLSPPYIEGYSTKVAEVILEATNGFEANLTNLGPQVGLDSLLCVLAIADLADPCDVFAVDAAGDEIPETRQRVEPRSPILLLGPGIFSVHATGTLTLQEVLLVGVTNGDGLELATMAEVAPFLAGVSCYEPQAYLGAPDTATGSLTTRLKADALARANADAPASGRLESEVHRAPRQALSDLVAQQRFVAQAAANFSSILAKPEWSYFEPVPGSGAQFEVVPTALIQAIALTGPVEATTLGQAVSFPVGGEFPVLNGLKEIFEFIRNEERLPFPLVRVETFHAGAGFVDNGNVADNRADPRIVRSTHFARLILLAEQTVDALPGKGRAPTALDKPASCEIRLLPTNKSRLDCFYVERSPGSGDFFVEGDGAGKDVIKAYFPSVDETDVLANGRAQFSTGPFDLPLEGPAPKSLGMYRRDVFGRWPKTSEAVCTLQPWPVQAPTLTHSRIDYTPSGRTLLVSTIGWDWALRTPKDLRLGVALVKQKEHLQEPLPKDGLLLHGEKRDLSIIFDGGGKPRWSAPVSSDFSLLEIAPPAPDPTDDTPSRGNPGDPDPRQYRLTIPLGLTSAIFDEVSSSYAVLTSDAWEAVSGSTEDRRSAEKARSINRLDDPRPPSFDGSLWKLHWASRANGGNVARAYLKAPEITGATKAATFNVWRANESSLLDFAVADVDPDDAASMLAAIRRETNMRVRLSMVQGLVMGRLSDTASFERFTGLFRAAETAAAEGGFEIDLPGTQAGLEFAMFTATSKAGVSSAKFDQKGLSNLYAVAIPVAAPPQQPSLQIITRDPREPLELLARSGLCVAIVGFEQRGSQRRVRFFWDDGPDVVDANQLLHEIEPIAELSVSEAKRYVEDVEASLQRITFGEKRIYMLRPPQSWLAHCFCVDTVATLPIGSDDPSNEIASRRSQLVRATLLPTSLPALVADPFPENGSRGVRPQGIFRETVPGYMPCEIMISLNDSDGTELERSGPITYRAFEAAGLKLASGVVAHYDEQDAKIQVHFGTKQSGRIVRVIATDPARRAVQVDLPIL